MIIVDTNVISYLLIQSDRTEQAEEVRRRDREWAAPALWRSEFGNVLMPYLRRGTLALPDALRLIELADDKVESRAVDPARVIELAFASGCTAYDCEFVCLAEKLNVPLVTSDKKLLAAFPGPAISMEAFLES